MNPASFIAWFQRKVLAAYYRKMRSFLKIWRNIIVYFVGERGNRRLRALQWWYRIRSRAILETKGGHVHSIAKRRQVRAWVDGSEAFPRILKLISRAHSTIFIQMFIWKDDETGRAVAEALLHAARRGVKIEIAKEKSGDMFEGLGDFSSTVKRRESMWKEFWNHPNIFVRQRFEYDHAKVYIFDGQVILIGGMNIADENRSDWHDYFIELRGAQFVEQFLTGKSDPEKSDIRIVQNTDHLRHIRLELEQMLLEARSWILVEHAYVTDKRVLDILARKSREGVRVTIILPKKANLMHNANHQSVQYLRVNGNPDRLQILVYPGMVHAKLILVDRRSVFVGSANLTAFSIDEMGEVNVLIKSRNRLALTKLREVVFRDIVHSKPLVNPPKWWLLGRVLALIGL